MKRTPYLKVVSDVTVDRDRYWRSLREHDQSPELLEELARELPEGIAQPPDGTTRRDFFRLMGASMALAGVAACRRPNEKIMPYSRQPEDLIPGVPLFFATSMPWNGTALGLLVESHEGRPTKIEGNQNHNESMGSANTWAQAEVLNLYDPDRSGNPSEKGTERSWDEAAGALRDLGAKAKAAKGKGLAILTEAHRSPTIQRLLSDVVKTMPEAKIFRYDAFARDNARLGANMAFGHAYDTYVALERAEVILSLDSDFLTHEGGSNVRLAKGFSAGRKVLTPGRMNRLYVVESNFSVTGANADHRLRLTSKQVSHFAVALARELNIGDGLPIPDLPPDATTLAKVVARDLRAAAHRGAILVGEKQPPIIHALMAHINVALNNMDSTTALLPAFDEGLEGARSIMELAKLIKDKTVTQLVILGGNPAFNAPADAGFAALLGGLEASFHLSLDVNETSAACAWHLNRAHFLESWGDVRSQDGLGSYIQPLIEPIFDGKTDAEVLSMLLGEPARAYDLVRKTHQIENADDEKTWRKALEEGFVDKTLEHGQPASLQRYDVSSLAEALQPVDGLEITFIPDEHAWDGRFANNGWMQELPANMTKLTWGNAALLSPATAAELGVGDGDHLVIESAGAKVTLPALLVPGHADKTLTLSVGQGRTQIGRVGKDIGVDTNPLRASTAFYVAGATVKAAGSSEKLARTQEHFLIEEPFTRHNRNMIREATVSQFATEPDFVRKTEELHPPLRSLFDDKDYSKVQKWALTIDLNTCIGCNACVTACVAENNIAVVGKKMVQMSREMHWIRIDRYFKGPKEDPISVTQPMTCQQCENAPCETVCPVAATTHSEEGLNDMVYNRCIGTKYCLNNCPFKVRHFNYFHYQKDLPTLRRAQFNPDVTVRSRGVMEKCTYCVQRINAAKIEAHKAGKDRVSEGRIKTACQQTCPTDAIQFGDLNDEESTVSRLKADPRSYVLLEEINVRPRTTYLAKIRNPNPELA